MAGVYIHIPFCRQKCYYCDFYKTINTGLTDRFISVLQKEIKLRKNYLEGEHVETIYWGGGTPSVLTEEQINKILSFIYAEFEVIPQAEITFEANPDDLDFEYLKSLKRTGINRLSVGIQAFQNQHLEKMNRRHNQEQAIISVKNAANAGFSNISVDLIYGLPGLTRQQWSESLERVFSLPAQHLSAYHLTYHEGTPFYTWLKKGTLKELDETESIEQFNSLAEGAEKAGFEQYEISNFARNGMYSKHNSAYWTGKKYLGLGPSAHSFNGESRQWNFAHIESYLKTFESKSPFFEVENLTENEKFNEYILTSLRTKWGVSTSYIEENFGKEKVSFFLATIQKYHLTGKVKQQNDIFTLTHEGVFISDDILANLMII
ncbi:MAG TPA: radical SAM family heme chaperone HemW [Draconibacterium sp.]|nr:radical SAM family heme chaperone HemW [Draconibacterium sp.]